MRRAMCGLALFVLAGLAVRALSEEPASLPRVTKSVDLTIINVDVVVTDKQGKRVRGLQAGDFEITYKKRKVAISNFFEYGSEAPVPAAAASTPVATSQAPTRESATASTPSRAPRHIVLFIDRMYLPEPDKRAALFDSMKAFLAKSMGPADSAMLVTWDRTIRLAVPFTSNRPKLDSYLTDIAKLTAVPRGDESTMYQLADEAAWFRYVSGEAGVTSTSMAPQRLAQEAFHDMKGKTAALNGLIATLGGLEGRRVLVFASHRFSRYAGLEHFMGRRAGLSEYMSPDARAFDTKSLMESVTAAANAHGVTLYTLLAAGDAADGVSAVQPNTEAPSINAAPIGTRDQYVVSNETEALGFLAERTGGAMAIGPQNAASLLPSVVEDLDSYYSLGFGAPPGGVEREIPIEVTTLNRSYKVRSRRALVEKSPGVEMKDRVLANFFRRNDETGLKFTARAKPLSEAKGRSTYTIELEIPIGQLAMVPKSQIHHGAFSVFVASASARGEFSEVTQMTKSFDIPEADLARAQKSHFTYAFEVVLNATEGRSSIGLVDDVGKTSGFRIVNLRSASAAAAKGYTQ